ncbi:TetR/AcrR family transcriptional regulator [Archangium violaceum]|uniref:TetR/AcrR family transcriptional regulator n=1 Tax=Archangium violaceum TaxID=83451 RepID=UPI00193B5546|nr:TetR/AcrR family transcriptional regulator [Archangium violaceum]QRK10734.1 TetR/AcrR family transcriptional regulator [Archangium violaceum]
MARSPGRPTPEAERPLRADARRNREQLLVAAHEAFTEYGADASLDDIARRAGVGIGTLYRHFPDRDALLVATLEERLVALRDKGRALLETPDAVDAVVAWMKVLIKHLTTYQGMVGTIRAGLHGVSTACEQVKEAGAALLSRAQTAGEIRSDIDHDDLEALAVAVAFTGQQPASEPARARRMLTVIIDGLRVRAPGTK